ncbi:MAG: sigma-54-dependent Fis family transcriptional regulator [Bacteroidales bacterium]|nr:sigma-54-dependent Fis family transcriptional regulator [Bacteroidales bacterium]
MKRKILIIDDEPTLGAGCKRVLEQENFEVSLRQNGRDGLKDALSDEYDLILLDLILPEIEGMEILKAIKSKGIRSAVIIITGYATIQTAVEAIRLGAADYISKPFSPDELIINVKRVFEHQELRDENIALRKELSLKEVFEGIIGDSVAMTKIFELINRVAPTDSNILITGESGTGKEVIAQAIHRTSLRKHQPFIACDCGALTPTLLESELFGHVKGSYSGAISTKQGLFEIANNGTLFLDEVSNISMEIQSKLLRVLETRMLRRVGDTAERNINIRLVAASNQDLTKLVNEGSFRNDLYYRLEVIPIHLPPLRERIDDIVKLATTFLDDIRKKSKIKARYFNPETIEILENYSWPGNIRELKNLVERVAILCDSETIEAKHLPKEIKNKYLNPSIGEVPATWEEFKSYKNQLKNDMISQIEMEFIRAALNDAGGNVSKAARKIGMQRTNFHSLLKKYNIQSGNY